MRKFVCDLLFFLKLSGFDFQLKDETQCLHTFPNNMSSLNSVESFFALLRFRIPLILKPLFVYLDRKVSYICM
ncbi:hypothetical protein DsansV1_C17g0148591 [Dioscorea sansibarensis]